MRQLGNASFFSTPKKGSLILLNACCLSSLWCLLLLLLFLHLCSHLKLEEVRSKDRRQRDNVKTEMKEKKRGMCVATVMCKTLKHT